MKEYTFTIRLQRKYAQGFFAGIRQPDLGNLQRRDAFLAELAAECPVRMEGTDLIVEIPDLDVAALMTAREKNPYTEVDAKRYHHSQVNDETEKERLTYRDTSAGRALAA